MPYRAYRCQICKENDTWFSALDTPGGRKAMARHMWDEHDEDVFEQLEVDHD